LKVCRKKKKKKKKKKALFKIVVNHEVKKSLWKDLELGKGLYLIGSQRN